jgi:hypothetical protein
LRPHVGDENDGEEDEEDKKKTRRVRKKWRTRKTKGDEISEPSGGVHMSATSAVSKGGEEILCSRSSSQTIPIFQRCP